MIISLRRDWSLGVREICDLRYNNSASAWELKVTWVGLEDAEAS